MCTYADGTDYDTVEKRVKREKIHNQIKQVLKNQLYGVLATCCEDQPYTSLLAFVASEDMKSVFVATKKNTHKYENLNRNDKIAFFIDNRSNKNDDVSKACTLTILGKAAPIDKNDKKKIEQQYLIRHPQLVEFIHSENIEFIRLTVSSFYFVKHFQNVFVLDITDENDSSI